MARRGDRPLNQKQPVTAKPPANIELAVIVPTYNERDNVIELLRRIDSVLGGVGYEVIFVDDDSSDGTADVIREVARHDPKVRVLQRIGRRGLASACVEGMLATAATYLAVIDADLQHDEGLLPVMLAKLKAEQLDLVVASRNVEGGSMANFAAWRVKLSNLGRNLSRAVSHCDLSDPMSGFFMLDRRFLDEVVHSLSSIGFKILLDLVASSGRQVRIAELPYHFRQRLHGESKLDILVGIEYFQLLADKLIGSFVPPRFLLFGMVGAAGVVLHLSLLYATLIWGGRSFVFSQTAATVLAIAFNFFLNNAITWRDRRLKGFAALKGLLWFYAGCSVGLFMNLQVASFGQSHGAPWYLAGLGGLAVSWVWNYAVSTALTWRQRQARIRSRPVGAAQVAAVFNPSERAS